MPAASNARHWASGQAGRTHAEGEVPGLHRGVELADRFTDGGVGEHLLHLGVVREEPRDVLVEVDIGGEDRGGRTRLDLGAVALEDVGQQPGLRLRRAHDGDPKRLGAGSRLILGLAERLRAHLDLVADAVGPTAQQAELLMRIDAPTRMSDLADQRVCDPSSITGLVQRLERDGFVSRTVDPRDGRVRIVRLTPKGRRARLRFQDSVGDGSAVAHNAARATFDVEVRERWSA